MAAERVVDRLIDFVRGKEALLDVPYFVGASRMSPSMPAFFLLLQLATLAA